jgi:hypothetical protein
MICRPSARDSWASEIYSCATADGIGGTALRLLRFYQSAALFERIGSVVQVLPAKSSAVIITSALIARRRPRFTFDADNPRG